MKGQIGALSGRIEALPGELSEQNRAFVLTVFGSVAVIATIILGVIQIVD